MSYKDMPTYALNLAIWAHLAQQWIVDVFTLCIVYSDTTSKDTPDLILAKINQPTEHTYENLIIPFIQVSPPIRMLHLYYVTTYNMSMMLPTQFTLTEARSVVFTLP